MERDKKWFDDVKDKIKVLYEADRDNCRSAYEELVEAVRTMKNERSPGSDGFLVEFLKFIWKYLCNLIFRCINECYNDGEFSHVQRQGVIACLPKNPKIDDI